MSLSEKSGPVIRIGWQVSASGHLSRLTDNSSPNTRSSVLLKPRQEMIYGLSALESEVLSSAFSPLK
jgi:hypothetical protein